MGFRRVQGSGVRVWGSGFRAILKGRFEHNFLFFITLNPLHNPYTAVKILVFKRAPKPTPL